jgi:sterol desaturase/sphingolipid hydroxylase (fatty acid hydroxylase superfamily)
MDYNIEINQIQDFVYSAVYPTWFIFRILLCSTLSAFFICTLTNTPFMNPQLYNKKYILDKISTVVNVGKGVIINYNIMYFALSQYYLHNDCYPIMTRLWNNVQFIILLEFIAYWYHRLSHSITYIYKNSHSQHHVNVEIYPIDFLEFDYIDNIAQTLYINLPLYFVPMNIYDYTMIYYIYATGAFLIHSNILTQDHIIHHRNFKYNYCLLLPLFDIVFDTYYDLRSR